MKKYLLLFLVLIMVVASLSGCNNLENTEKIKVVCTSFASYSWTTELIRNTQNVQVDYLLDGGEDIHSFNPSVKDFAVLSSCDLLILVGGGSDTFALKNIGEDTQVVNMFSELEAKIKHEEIIDGMQHEDTDHEDEIFDEHVWLSINNAKLICEKITAKLSELDGDNSEIYNRNLKDYLDQLNTLDNKYRQTVSNAKQKTLIFADRFPFRYLLDEYGVEYFAAFPGCSTDTDASFKTIIFLAQKIDSLSINAVITTEKYNHKIPQTVIENTINKNAKILSMNAMQSVELDGSLSYSKSYISIMTENLSVMQKALN